jgi:methionine aminotransferase
MSKLPKVGTTIFSVMSQMATEFNAVNLSQGFPNFPVDPKLKEILIEKTKQDVHQYAPMAGSPALLTAVAELVDNAYGRTVDASSEVLITAGATQAIFTTIQALVNTGDEVVILDPSYDCYEPPVVLCGAHPIRIPLNEYFLPDWNRIYDSVNQRTRMLIINNPHNPSGRVWSEEDFSALEQLMEKYPQLVLLSDEVYEFITFEKKHISVNQRPLLRDRSVIVSSFGKTFHITGWKIGYLIAPAKLMTEIKKVHQFLVFSVNSVAQATLSAYLPTVDVQQLGQFYQDKRDFFRNLIRESRFELLPSEGTYFQLASYKEISDENDVDFTRRMVKEFGVAAIPLSVFNEDGLDRKLIRFCFAKDSETLTKAADRLCKI